MLLAERVGAGGVGGLDGVVLGVVAGFSFGAGFGFDAGVAREVAVAQRLRGADVGADGVAEAAGAAHLNVGAVASVATRVLLLPVDTHVGYVGCSWSLVEMCERELLVESSRDVCVASTTVSSRDAD